MPYGIISALYQGSGESGGFVVWIGVAGAIVLVLLIALTLKTRTGNSNSNSNGNGNGMHQLQRKRAFTANNVETKRFTTTRFQEGYEMTQVDDLLAKAAAELRRLEDENTSLQRQPAASGRGAVPAATPILTAEAVVKQKFNPTRIRAGYAQDEVDDFLDELVLALRTWTSENEELRARSVDGGASSR